MRARLRWASARSGRRAGAGCVTPRRLPSAWVPRKSLPPRLTNGTLVPYSVSGTGTPIPIVAQSGRRNQTLSQRGRRRRGRAIGFGPRLVARKDHHDLDPRRGLDQDRRTTRAGPDLDPKRFRALAIIAVAQLMVVLDASVVIIALPSAQRALHISTANRQWMLTAYTLSFAGLLLLGGRIADYFGRKRMFVISLDRLRRRLRPRRPGPELGHALQRPRPAGRLRRRHGARPPSRC